MEINWGHIKEVWDVGIEDLHNVAESYGLTVPEVTIEARKRGWGDRGAEMPIIRELSGPILTDKEVILADKTDLGRLRLIAATLLENLQYEPDQAMVLKVAERLTKIYSQIIPLERKVFGLDTTSEGIPDGIIINMRGND